MRPAALLNEFGICALADPYSPSDIRLLNDAVDQTLRARSSERRSYVHVDEMSRLGILDVVLGPAMRDVLFAIMPDPVLHHLFVIETACHDPEPNLFGDYLAGWHRDYDSSLTPREPTHVSVFTYLTETGVDDGAFEFVPQYPERWLRSSTPALLVTGPVGYTFAWQRSFFHRASPNRGPHRRRLIKISIQRNAFRSNHIENEHFRRAIADVPQGDPARDILFGRYQGRTAPTVARPDTVEARAIPPNGRLSLPDAQLTKAQLRDRATAVKRRVRMMISPDVQPVAYE